MVDVHVPHWNGFKVGISRFRGTQIYFFPTGKSQCSWLELWLVKFVVQLIKSANCVC